MTPVTETYSQMGSVQRAMRRCGSKRPRNPRESVISASGHDDDGQNGVRAEKREIDGANPALAQEVHDAGLGVIGEIGDQEDNRAGECGQHTSACAP